MHANFRIEKDGKIVYIGTKPLTCGDIVDGIEVVKE